MKAINNYVIVEQEVQSSGAIIMKENNIGRVISCACDESLVGKSVIFDTSKRIAEYDALKFVPYEFVMAVLD